jgi:two-component system KDP operon response regulator KdpE
MTSNRRAKISADHGRVILAVFFREGIFNRIGFSKGVIMKDKTILIVEDDKDISLALSVRLISHGYTTLTAPDAGSAIRLATMKKPDLILLDLGLPDSNGFIVMEIVSQLKFAARVPVIVVSARSAEVYRDAAILAGARDYFQKPFDNDALLKAIQRETGEEPPLLVEYASY